MGLKRTKKQSGKAPKKAKKTEKKSKAKRTQQKPKRGRLIFRCSPPYLHKLVAELASEVSLEQISALKRTPFGRFWDIRNIPVSSKFLIGDPRAGPSAGWSTSPSSSDQAS